MAQHIEGSAAPGLIKRLSLNTRGRDLAVGDIHGHFTKLRAALDAVGFNPEVDRVISVGDLVDRGPESEEALAWLAQPWFHAVRGNHEQMCIEVVDAYFHAQAGGAWFIGKTPAEKAEFIIAFEDLPVAIEVETAGGLVGIVHASPVLSSWSDLRARLHAEGGDGPLATAVMWQDHSMGTLFFGGVADMRAVVVGHTPVERATSLDNVIYIDTGAWLPETRFPGKAFTVLDLDTLQPATAADPTLWGGA